MPRLLLGHADAARRKSIGAVVEVDRLGQRFHALVAGHARAAYRPSRLTGAPDAGAAEPMM
jgi:hypothetical protein